MKSTVVFLDIDGVLQPGFSQKRFNNNLDELKYHLSQKYDIPAYEKYDKYDLGAVFYDWDPESVENLKLLLKSTQADIVLSSSWRRAKSLTVLKHYFKIYHLDEFLVDCTPVIERVARAKEVEAYLINHPEIKKFVILDDDNSGFSTQFPNHFVHTAKEGRFTKHHLETSLEMIKNQST